MGFEVKVVVDEVGRAPLIVEVETPVDWCAHPMFGDAHKRFVASEGNAGQDAQVRRLRDQLASQTALTEAASANAGMLQAKLDALWNSRSVRLARKARSAINLVGKVKRLACERTLTSFNGRRYRPSHATCSLIDKSRLFDGDWYLSRYPDVAHAGIDPLQHFVRFGAKEGRSPSALFDIEWYLKIYPDVATSGMNPLVHYIKQGSSEGRSPHPLFDAEWLKATIGDDGGGEDTALALYLARIGISNVWPVNMQARRQAMLQLKSFASLDQYIERMTAEARWE